jgi:hypothetical protein
MSNGVEALSGRKAKSRFQLAPFGKGIRQEKWHLQACPSVPTDELDSE